MLTSTPVWETMIYAALAAVIFAATRSLAEAEQVMLREDETIVWGVGSHPKLAQSHESFSQEMFADLVKRAAFVGEVGLDGSAKVALERQQQTLRSVLDVLKQHPRIVSLHSYRSADLLLDELNTRPIRGAVLHWWLGSRARNTTSSGTRLLLLGQRGHASTSGNAEQHAVRPTSHRDRPPIRRSVLAGSSTARPRATRRARHCPLQQT